MLVRRLLAVACVSCCALLAVAATARNFGQPLKNAAPVALAQLAAHPDQFAGKTVRVEGKVAAVCSHAGCWMDLVGANDTERFRLKVDDGVIVFPQDAVGHKAVAEGVVTKVETKPADAAKHDHKEGEDCTEHAKATYVLKVTGAVIH